MPLLSSCTAKEFSAITTESAPTQPRGNHTFTQSYTEKEFIPLLGPINDKWFMPLSGPIRDKGGMSLHVPAFISFFHKQGQYLHPIL